MTPGRLVRKLLGPAFTPVGEAYRRIFVDMPRVVAMMATHIPPGAHVLDVGGGDGYVVGLLLDLRSDIRVTMTDVASSIGAFLSPRHLERVMLLPATDVESVGGRFDIITVADVVHHVPAADRQAFFRALEDAACRTGADTILVKDVQPGNVRALLSLWSDLYITGDKNVSLVALGEIRFPNFRRQWSAMPDFPNYCAGFSYSRP